MLDHLILAYRFKFYDWDWLKIKEFYIKNRIPLWVLLGYILVSLLALGYYIYTRSFMFLNIFFILELIFGICVDRLTVKRYQQFVLRKQEHLNEVVLFLQTTVPNHNLYSAKQIEEIIQRLTKRIEEKIPLKNFKSSFSSFGKMIILPAIMFIAGVYSSTISQMSFQTVFTWTVSIILLLGVLSLIWHVLSQALQKISFRDYDAAVALREDLLDIQLLFFKDESPSQIIG